MKLRDEVDRTRLFKSCETSYRALEPFRNQTRALVEEYAGSGYGRTTHARHEIIINLMNQTVDAYTMALAANRPRVMATSSDPNLAYFAKHFQTAINNLIEEIGLEFTLRQWVLDAFFCVGILKIHMADSGYVQLEEDRWADPGRPFASNVSLDNFVFDMGVPKWEQVKYAGDSYRIPFEDLKGETFDQRIVRGLVPTSKLGIQDERLERFSRGTEIDQDELEPMIDLADIWSPRDAKIYTFALDSRAFFRLKGEPVAVMDWTGDERGPYPILGFNDVPENIMPTSPASQVGSLARLANNLIRKQSRQARSQKTNTTYTPAGANSAKKLQLASDGQMIEVQDTKELGTIKTGGVDPANHAFLLGVMEMFDRMAGNLTTMLGLGAQADTASQEKLIHGAVNKKEAQMAYRVIDGSVRVVRSLGKMLWDDQAKTIPGRIPIEGAEGYSVDATWTPQDREGKFEDYKLNIDLYSMAYQSPQQKLSTIMQIMTQLYFPNAQALMQQGGQINLQKLTKAVAELTNIHEFEDIVQFNNVLPSQEEQGEDDGGHMPANTSRTYTRKSASAGQPAQGRSAELMAMAQGSQQPQPGSPA